MELLVTALDKVNTDPTMDLGCSKVGDIIQTYPDGACREQPAPIVPGGNQNIIVKVPGFTRDDTHAAVWERIVDYAVVSSNLATDVFRLTVGAVAGEFNATNGEGKITRAIVETFLNNWGATVVSSADNSVTFDAGILNAIKSTRFWGGQDVSGVTFAELSYTQATGAHSVRATYPAAWPSQQVADTVAAAGATITAHNVNTRKITFTITRAIVRQAFQDDVAQKARTILRKRKYHLDPAFVASVAAGERWITILPADYLSVLKNRTTD